MARTQKVIVFTDVHFTARGELIIGLDPAERFTEGLAHALARHGDAARVLILGDLAHHGAPEEYARLRQVLADCPLPVSLMLGNHDRRAAFLDAFPDISTTDSGFVQSCVDLDGWRLILMDTLDEDAPDLHSGFLCEDRLQWLDTALKDAGKRKCILCTHHPTFETGFRGMDAIGLRNRTAVADRLTRHANLRQILSGHVHRTVSGATKGIPSVVFKSTCHQMPMLLDETGSGHSVDEPGAYGLLLLRENDVIVHTEDFALSNGMVQDF